MLELKLKLNDKAKEALDYLMEKYSYASRTDAIRNVIMQRYFEELEKGKPVRLVTIPTFSTTGTLVSTGTYSSGQTPNLSFTLPNDEPPKKQRRKKKWTTLTRE